MSQKNISIIAIAVAVVLAIVAIYQQTQIGKLRDELAQLQKAVPITTLHLVVGALLLAASALLTLRALARSGGGAALQGATR